MMRVGGGRGSTIQKPVQIIEVWEKDLKESLRLIQDVVRSGRFRYACFDTEFPGTIYPYKFTTMNSESNYRWMKLNIDAMNIIQLGLTLSDEDGNLPDFGTGCSYIWQFNFKDFNVHQDKNQNEESIKLLRRNGIDFEENIKRGIDSRDFRLFLLASGLLKLEPSNTSSITWITFQGSYDFGLLIKILMGGRPLPETLGGFLNYVRGIFGPKLYDMKYICQRRGVHGGLDKIANLLHVSRTVGKSHQAASDSLLTLESFRELHRWIFPGCGFAHLPVAFPNEVSVLYGLTSPPPVPQPTPVPRPTPWIPIVVDTRVVPIVGVFGELLYNVTVT